MEEFNSQLVDTEKRLTKSLEQKYELLLRDQQMSFRLMYSKLGSLQMAFLDYHRRTNYILYALGTTSVIGITVAVLAILL